MRNSYAFAAVRSAVVDLFTNEFFRRLTTSVLLTGFNGSVLFAVLPTIREASKDIPWLTTVFTVLVFGLIATLARTWYLTFRHRNLKRIPITQDIELLKRRAL